MHSIDIYLFGPFEVLVNGHKIKNKLWQSRQVRGMLKLLSARRGHVVTSDQIIDSLWPDDEPEAAQKRLYVRISQLRKLLKIDEQPGPIQNVSGGYIFKYDLSSGDTQRAWVDVDAFEQSADHGQQLLSQKQFQAAVEVLKVARHLYRGDYLAEDIYEDWTIGERERLRERYLVVLTELGEAYAQLGYFRKAINECQHILSLDPWREAVYVRLMLYHYYAGDKLKALQAYSQCKQNLLGQLGLEPDSSTTWLARRIEDGNLWLQEEAPSYPPPAYEGRLFEVPYSLGDTPFCGRDREYAWIVQHWRTNPKGVIWISGEAGIGKTRLAEAFLRSAEIKGVEVFKLRVPRDQRLPYKAWVDALRMNRGLLETHGLDDHSRAMLAGLLDDHTNIVLRGYQPASKPFAADPIHQAFTELVLSKASQVLVWIDDAHLLDPDSLTLLESLIGRVGILVTSRQAETHGNHPFTFFVERAKTELGSLELRPWPLVEVRHFLKRLGGEEFQMLAEDLHAITQGNPLFIVASLQHLFEEGILYVAGTGEWAQCAEIGNALAPDVEAAIALRLNSLQISDRHILDVVAVSGGEIDYETLGEVLEREESQLLTRADLLISQGLLVEPRDIDTPELKLAHGLYGEVLYKNLPKARRRIYHRRIAAAMLKAGQDSAFHASTLARHFHLGGADDKACPYARNAGEYALRLYAPHKAIQHFEDALSWMKQLEMGDKENFTAEIWMGMAEAARLLGDYDRAIRTYQKALPFLKGELKGAAIFQIFNLKILHGEPLSIYEELTTEYEPLLVQEGDSWALALFNWSQSFVALLRGKAKETRLHMAKGWRVARRLKAVGEPAPPWIYQRAISILMRAHNQWGNYFWSIHFAERILSHGSRSESDANTQAAVSTSLGESHFRLGHYDLAENAFSHCYELATKAGDPRLQGEALIGLSRLYFARGEFSQARDYAEQVLALVSTKGDILRKVNAQLMLICLAIQSEVKPEHFTAMENILFIARYQDAQSYIPGCLLILAELHLSRQEAVKAKACAQEAFECAERCGLKLEQSAASGCLARAKAKQGDFEGAYRLANDALTRAEAIHTPFEIGLALRTRAMLQANPQAGIMDAEKAFSLFENMGAKYEAQKTRTLLISMKEANGRR